MYFHDRSAVQRNYLNTQNGIDSHYDYSRYSGPSSPYDFPTSPQKVYGNRKGKWTVEEENYTNKVIWCFNAGTLPIAPNETHVTLRAYLAEKLDCDPMRITKKYTGASCLGKRVYRIARSDDVSEEQLIQDQIELSMLEKAFQAKLDQMRNKKLLQGMSYEGGGGKGGKAGRLNTPAIEAMIRQGVMLDSYPSSSPLYPAQQRVRQDSFNAHYSLPSSLLQATQDHYLEQLSREAAEAIAGQQEAVTLGFNPVDPPMPPYADSYSYSSDSSVPPIAPQPVLSQNSSPYQHKYNWNQQTTSDTSVSNGNSQNNAPGAQNGQSISTSSLNKPDSGGGELLLEHSETLTKIPVMSGSLLPIPATLPAFASPVTSCDESSTGGNSGKSNHSSGFTNELEPIKEEEEKGKGSPATLTTAASRQMANYTSDEHSECGGSKNTSPTNKRKRKMSEGSLDADHAARSLLGFFRQFHKSHHQERKPPVAAAGVAL